RLRPHRIRSADESFSQPGDDKENPAVCRVQQEKCRAEAAVRRHEVHTLGGLQTSPSIIASPQPNAIDPGTRGVDNHPRSNGQLDTAHAVPFAYAADLTGAAL